ncbi:MAG: metal ABC transporter ATP-binding protein [Candidatus Andersenbacteria bacterium]|nr:metal ABC transporter ATP-binding protein [Candidatus Andersenbacteria bacterium]
MHQIIKIKNLSFSYQKGNDALENINLEVFGNDFLGIIGPNGGGKTTLLKIILGLLNPDKGNVLVFDKKPKKARDLIGYVPQFLEIDLDCPVSVLDIVLMGILGRKKMFQKYNNQDLELAKQALDFVDLWNLKDKQIGELSGGQRQRIYIARALIRKPKLLILDEPTASIDEKSERDFWELLKEINKNSAVIIVSHDIGVIFKNVNKIACLNKQLYCHDAGEITQETLDKTYKCDIEILGHGLPHRVLKKHK